MDYHEDSEGDEVSSSYSLLLRGIEGVESSVLEVQKGLEHLIQEKCRRRGFKGQISLPLPLLSFMVKGVEILSLIPEVREEVLKEKGVHQDHNYYKIHLEEDKGDENQGVKDKEVTVIIDDNNRIEEIYDDNIGPVPADEADYYDYLEEDEVQINTRWLRGLYKDQEYHYDEDDLYGNDPHQFLDLLDDIEDDTTTDTTNSSSDCSEDEDLKIENRKSISIPNTFKCREPDCPRTFQFLGHMDRHFNSKHGHCQPQDKDEVQEVDKTSSPEVHENIVVQCRLVPFNCPHPPCSRIFQSHKAMRMHFSSVHEPQPRPRQPRKQAMRCRKELRKPEILQLDKNEQNGQSPNVNQEHICELCQKILSSRAKLRAHRIYTHLRDSFTLKITEEEEISAVQRDLASLSQPPFNCPVCTLDFFTPDMVGTHVVRNHLKEEDKPRFGWEKSGTAQQRQFFCPFCDKGFFFKSNLLNHLKKVHVKDRIRQKVKEGDDLYPTIKRWISHDLTEDPACPVCGIEYKFWGKREIHLAIYHLEEEERVKVLPNWNIQQQEKDPKASKTGVNADLHPQSGENGLFACPLCSKKFPTELRFKVHLNSHNHYHFLKKSKKIFVPRRPLPRRYTCLRPDCGKRFHSPYALTKHTRSHTGEKPFKCPSCEKWFRNPSDIRGHQKYVHTEAKRFQCHMCHKVFKTESTLKRHGATVHDPGRQKVREVKHSS